MAGISTELNQKGRAMVTSFDRFVSRNLGLVIATNIYLFMTILGLEFQSLLSKSPLVYYVGFASGRLFSILSGAFAAFTAGLVFGLFDFVKEVFHLYRHNYFHIATSLIFLSIPAARFTLAVTNRLVRSYLKKKIIFFLCLISLTLELACLLDCISFGRHGPGAGFIFSFSVLFIAYAVITRIYTE